MIVLISMLSILGGTCLACNAGRTPYEKHAEMISGLLFVVGLGMIGAFLPILR